MHNTLKDETTADTITVSKQLDGNKNTVVVLSGTIKDKRDSTFKVINVEDLCGRPTGLRLDNIIFVIETGLKVHLSYEDVPYILPLEGRGKCELDPIGGLAGHKVKCTFKGIGAFFISLDISKLGV
jgi:hypothetical protein